MERVGWKKKSGVGGFTGDKAVESEKICKRKERCGAWTPGNINGGSG